MKSPNHIVSHYTLVRNCTYARKKCKELLKQLAKVEEENISLQNLLESASKTEKSIKVENNSLMTKLFDTNKICVNLLDENQLLMNKMDGINALEEAQKEESLNGSPSSKLDTILSMQKSFGDKHGI